MGTDGHWKVKYSRCARRLSLLTHWVHSCAFSSCASAYLEIWLQVWKLCARYATNPLTCRAACHTMRIILSLELVDYSHISEDVDSMLQSMDVNGPATLCDSSIALCCLFVEKRGNDSTRRLFQWFSSKWCPGRSIPTTSKSEM